MPRRTLPVPPRKVVRLAVVLVLAQVRPLGAATATLAAAAPLLLVVLVAGAHLVLESLAVAVHLRGTAPLSGGFLAPTAQAVVEVEVVTAG